MRTARPGAVLAAMQRSFEAMSKRLATSDSEYAQGHEFGYRAAAQSAADYMGIAIESFKGRL